MTVKSGPDHLTILWTSGEADTAHRMVFMYATNALLRGWWKSVTVVIWGASAGLVMADVGVRERIALAQEQGVHISACIACASQYGAVDALREQGIEVIGWGEPLTELIKSGAHILSV